MLDLTLMPNYYFNNVVFFNNIDDIFATMNKFERVSLFCRVVELGSYSSAAQERGMSRSAVSRSINQLECDLQVQLFNRTTRSLSLTEAGRELYKEGERILRDFEALEDKLRQDRTEVKGLIRIGVPGPLNDRYILKQIENFQELYPEVSIFLQVSEGISDLYKDDLDIVIRMGLLKDSSLKAVKLADMSFTTACSQSYIDKNTIPVIPSDLSEHNVLCFRDQGRGTSTTFYNGRKVVKVPLSGNFSADCGKSLRAMAKKGHGIVCMPTILIKDELENKELMPILRDWQPVNSEHSGIYLLFHPDRQPLQRIRAFIDFMKQVKLD